MYYDGRGGVGVESDVMRGRDGCVLGEKLVIARETSHTWWENESLMKLAANILLDRK